MFGRNGFVETVKAALIETQCDMEAFRRWQKQYDRLIKKRKETEEQYLCCRRRTLLVQQDAGQMERMLTDGSIVDAKAFGRLLKELKQMRGKFDHEFLVSSEDQEFHSTYDTILRLGVRALASQDEKLLLQSEIENLLDLLKENLEKEQPPFAALAFYEQMGNTKQLEEVSPAERLSRIQTVYETEFCEPIMQILTKEIAKAKRLAVVCEQENDRSSKKALAALEVLRDARPEYIFERMMEEG